MRHLLFRAVANLCTSLQQLWVAGLALTQIYRLDFSMPADDFQATWAQYLLLGTLFPALVLLVSFFSRGGRPDPLAIRIIKTGLGLMCVAIPLTFVIQEADSMCVGIGAAHCMFLAVVLAVRRWFGTRGPELPSLPVCIFVVIACWAASWRMLWWTSIGQYLSTSYITVLVFLAATALATMNLFPRMAGAERRPFRILTFGNAAAFVLFLLAATRIDYQSGLTGIGGPFLHWGVMVAPAELVRQGGWLLWDVPSQYGFLSTLTLAWLPTHSVWQSLYVVQIVLNCAVASFLFLLLRSLRHGVASYFFSVAIALAAVFLLPGWPPVLIGHYFFPSIGPFRFFWAYALLAIVIWAYRTPPGVSLQKRILAIGCVAWMLGSLWSGESMTFCAAIWLPAYFLLILRRASARYPAPNEYALRAHMTLGALALPPLLLGSAVGGISGYYQLRLGHVPDWRAFIDYCAASAFFSFALEKAGPVCTLLLVFVGVAIVVGALIGRRDALGGLALATAAWAALWATCSYFVARSHPSNATNQAPMICTAIAICLYLIARGQVAERVAFYIRAGAIPVLSVLLTIALGNPQVVAHYATSMQRGYVWKVDHLLPPIDPVCANLLESAHVKPDEPILFIDGINVQGPLPARWTRDAHSAPTLLTSYRAWLPTAPFALLLPLPVERKTVYVERFGERTHMSGWLLEPKHHKEPLTWFYDSLQRTHSAQYRFESGPWQLTWYKWKGELARAR